MTNWTKIVNANSLTHCRIAAKMSFLLFFPTRFAHARYSSRMIDRFLNWGYHEKPKSGKIKGRCQPPLVWKNDIREHGRMFASAKGKQQKQVRQLQCQEQCIDHIPYYLSALLFACTFFSDNLSRNSCIYNQNKYCFPPSKANWNYSLIKTW